MTERPIVQINLPAMPNPKDFCISSNATTNAGLWQIALNAWREAIAATAQVAAQSLAADAPDHPTEPITRTKYDPDKN